MANVIKLRKGLDINIKGKASEEIVSIESPKSYSLCPDDFTGVKPKVVVKEGDKVKAGDPLFVDKMHPQLKFVSPVSGVVTSVERGARRKVMNITVEADGNDDSKEFIVNSKDLNAEDMINLLQDSGLFAFIRQRPYDIIANPEQRPQAIFISGFDSNPLAPSSNLTFNGEEENFQNGLTALSKIAKTYLSISTKQTELTKVQDVEINVIDGPHPAGNVGVQINHIRPINKGEVIWTIDPEAVIFIGRLLNTGKVDMTRTIAVTGSEVSRPAHCKIKVGAQLTNIFKGNVSSGKELRYISGNVLTGKTVSADGYLGAFSRQVTVIPEGDNIHEMLGWIMPRTNQFSANHSYFSWLMPKKEYTFDARVKGGPRHMIMSGEYTKVFPMDIYPEFLIKATIAGDIDKMEQLGIYEVAPEDFSLCEFVCSSKVEIQRIIRNGLDMLRAEMS